MKEKIRLYISSFFYLNTQSLFTGNSSHELEVKGSCILIFFFLFGIGTIKQNIFHSFFSRKKFCITITFPTNLTKKMKTYIMLHHVTRKTKQKYGKYNWINPVQSNPQARSSNVISYLGAISLISMKRVQFTSSCFTICCYLGLLSHATSAFLHQQKFVEYN